MISDTNAIERACKSIGCDFDRLRRAGFSAGAQHDRCRRSFIDAVGQIFNSIACGDVADVETGRTGGAFFEQDREFGLIDRRFGGLSQITGNRRREVGLRCLAAVFVEQDHTELDFAVHVGQRRDVDGDFLRFLETTREAEGARRDLDVDIGAEAVDCDGPVGGHIIGVADGPGERAAR